MPTKVSDVVKKNTKPEKPTPAQRLELEREKLRAKQADSKALLREALQEAEKLQKQIDLYEAINVHTPQFFELLPTLKRGDSESAAVILWSDWHAEERVKPEAVGGKNEYNLEIFKQRRDTLFEGSRRMVEIAKKDTTVNHVVLGLLGDFFTGNIQEDTNQSNQLGLASVVNLIEDSLVSGIKYMLDGTDEDTRFTIVTHSGNHGRITRKQMHASESENSMEQVMYRHIFKFFQSLPKYNDRIDWLVSEGYHSRVKVFDNYLLRLHHGHNLMYNGGVGGITIPVNKAISNWNKSEKQVPNHDCFGHFHTSLQTNSFVANGSLIGYNAYAVAIKAEFEPPSQTFFLVNKGWNDRSMTTKLFVEPKKY